MYQLSATIKPTTTILGLLKGREPIEFLLFSRVLLADPSEQLNQPSKSLELSKPLVPFPLPLASIPLSFPLALPLPKAHVEPAYGILDEPAGGALPFPLPLPEILIEPHDDEAAAVDGALPFPLPLPEILVEPHDDEVAAVDGALSIPLPLLLPACGTNAEAAATTADVEPSACGQLLLLCPFALHKLQVIWRSYL